MSGIFYFYVLRGNFVDFFPNFEKKIPILQKKQQTFFLGRLGFSFSQFTYKLHGGILLQFNGNSMCNIYFFFLLTKNDIIVHNNKFPNLGVCCANFPRSERPWGPFPKSQKNLWICVVTIIP